MQDLGEPTAGQRHGSNRYLILLLTAIFTLNFLDRQIVSILAGPIKAELGLSNGALGLLAGFSFALFYSALGLPIALIADRISRIWVIGGSAIIWSFMTILCGQATNFWQLFLARVGVGIGEAGCVPASHALIADRLPPRDHAFALAIFALGIPLGTLCGLAIGGWVAQEYGWRTAFLVAGVPGLVLGPLALLTLKDRRGPVTRSDARPSLVAVARQLRTNRTFVLAVLGAILASGAGYGIVAFLGVYLVEARAFSLAQAGLALGLILGTGGAIGTAAGGRIVSSLGGIRAHALVPAAGVAAAAPLTFAGIAQPDTTGLLVALFLATLASSLWYGPIFALIQSTAGGHSRAVVAAIFTFMVNMIGLGLGPPLVGLLSDALPAAGIGGNTSDLGMALQLTAFLYVAAAVSFFYIGRNAPAARA